MSTIFRIIKNLVLWSYGRTTWQYDVLCALILAFIFLTPRSWFENSEPSRWNAHQNQSTAVWLLIWPENLTANPDLQEVERRVRTMTGHSDVLVKEVHPVTTEDGKIIAYKVDIE